MSRAEVIRLNQQKLFRDNVEINKSAIAIAKLTNGISEAKKTKKGSKAGIKEDGK